MEKRTLVLWLTALEAYKRQNHLFGYSALTEFRQYGIFDLLTKNQSSLENLSYTQLASRITDYISSKREEQEQRLTKPKRKPSTRSKEK